MSAADNIALPVWALNQEGHALVERVIAERPDYFIRSGAWIEGGGVKVYKGKTAGQLRAMFNRWWDANFETERLPEDGNQLIERVLRETAQVALLDMTVQSLGGGTYRVAA
jgi:hypothetical protein